MPNGMTDAIPYGSRVVDNEVEALISGLPAISIEGAKGVGKTSTALRFARSVVRLDSSVDLELVRADPSSLVEGRPPRLIDEWQRFPESWDLVRRAVDVNPTSGRFLLTGSATPATRPTHSGAGRIVSVRMRPLSFAERDIETATVSVSDLCAGERPTIGGETAVRLAEYADEIVRGGFPGLRRANSGRAARAALDGYLDRIIDVDIRDAGFEVRRPNTLRRWLSAFAAAVATTSSWEKIRNAATPGEDEKPAKTTTMPYREVLERLWILDDVPAWATTSSHLHRLVGAPKHHLADPALAARLVGATPESLLDGLGPDAIPRDGTYLGALFESLAALSIRVYAQAAECRVGHLRTRRGEREIDLLVERADQRVLAFEVKLSATVDDDDVRHLLWLRDTIGPGLVDAVVITTGPYAYRRPDGIAVVPLALLGP